MTQEIIRNGSHMISGWADDGEPLNGFKLAPKALRWDRMPILSLDFNRVCAGQINILEYRDDNLWIEATLFDPLPPDIPFRFGVSFMLKEYEWHTVEKQDDLLYVFEGNLMQVSIVNEEYRK